MEETYIKLFTKFLQWEWYDDMNTKCVFLHLLLKAEPEDTRWHGIEVKRGQLITSRSKLAEELGISERSIRTCLDRLVTTNEVTKQTTKQMTIITICKYDSYQGYSPTTDQANDQRSDQAPTNHRPSTDQPLTSKLQELIEDMKEVGNTPSNENDIYINNINNNNYIYSEKEKEKKKKKVDYAAELAKRQQEFYNSLIPFVDEYGKALVREFYDYWSEPLQFGRKFRKETERTWDTKRRLDRWRKNNDQKQYGNKQDRDRRRAMEVTAKTSEDYMPL